MPPIESGEIFLPKEPTLEAVDMRHMKWLIYGPPGVGKSTLIAQAGQVLFLTTDGGTRFISSMARPIDSWRTFKKYVRLLQVERPKQYKGVCLDVIDSLHKMCVKATCEARNIQHQSDEAYGKAYDISNAEFETEIEKLVGLGYGLFLTSHSKDAEKKTRFSTIHKTQPTLSGQGYKIIYPIMDIVAYMGFDAQSGPDGEMGRRIFFQPNESLEAKDRTTMLPESLPLPKPEEANGFEVIEKYLMSGGIKSSSRKEAATKVTPSKKVIIKKKK